MRSRYAFVIVLAAALAGASTLAVNAQTPPASGLRKMAPPIRGQVEVGYTQAAKRDGNTIVTVFEVKNLSATGSIIGLQVSEFWYDKAGELLQGTGDRQRLKQPLGPNEIATITLKSPVVANMTGAKPQYKFSHQNGDVKLKLMKSLKTS